MLHLQPQRRPPVSDRLTKNKGQISSASETRKLVAIQENGLEEKCQLLLHIVGNLPEPNAPLFKDYARWAHQRIGWERFG